MSSPFLSKFSILFLFGFFIFQFTATTTLGQVSNIKTSYQKFESYNLQEKIYVHTDRSFYVCGEILWFKAYLTNATNNLPLSISKVIYVEILNALHQPVLQGKIAMKDGLGSGSFSLPFSLSSGNYEVRAYTNWMKNFSQDNYFKKNVTIINTTRNLDSSAVHESVSYTANFFPEGGNLVNGLESEIAFKVSDNKSKGIDCEGVVVDQTNDTIVRFKSYHSGIGHFFLTPETGKNYIAVINCTDGSVIRKNISKAYEAGYVMHVGDTGSNDLKISVAAKGLKQDIAQEVYVIIQNSGNITFAKSQAIEDAHTDLLLSKDSLKDGVTRITIFDANKQPQCERLYFKRPKNKLLITAKSDKNSYNLRGKILVDVSTTDELKQSLSGNLSVSVFRIDSLYQPVQEDIFSYLWLSSNLQGTTENPAYYFSNENTETNEALDNLLLAQGWRKFNWEKAMQNKIPSFTYVPENAGHIITGRITNEATKRPAPDVLVYLSVPGRRVQLKGCISDSAGLVHFDMKDFIGSSQIVLQTNTGIDSIYRIEIFTPFSGEFSDDSIPPLHVSEKDNDYLQNKNFHMEVENSYHEKDLKTLQISMADTLPFYNKPFKTYPLDNYTRFTTMEEVMREYVDEVSVRRQGENYRLMTLDESAIAVSNKQTVDLMFKDNPLVLLDGVPVFNINKIIAYDPLKVQKLEVVASKYYWGPITAEGIASYTTYKGDLNGYILDPNDLVLDYDALQQQRIFYSPDYSSDKELQSRLPDYRDILYWSPEVKTNANGKGGFSFYAGDIPGKYFVVLQGISSYGNAGATGIILNIEK